jgi:2OG-Fe(II) oxygenase superfamily
MMGAMMFTETEVAKWVQPQHLTDEALEEVRTSFQTHPAKVTVLHRFLLDPIAERLAKFLSVEAEFGKEQGLYSVDGPVSDEQWDQAADEDRLFRLSRLAGIPPQFKMSPNALKYLQFRQTFQKPEFERFFEALTGLSLGASDDFGVHSMSVGDFLRPHSDDVRNRRVALVIYLSPHWRPEYGGDLHVVDRDGRETIVEAEYNSMVIFDVLAETTHLVAPIEPAAGEARRLTIGGWYHKPE